MKKILGFLLLGLPLVSLAEDYQSTLLVQTGTLRESDLIVRTVSVHRSARWGISRKANWSSES